jgi:hypothetical protein
MSGLLKNLLFALGLALILWLGYVLFFQDDGTNQVNNAVNTQAALETEEFLIRLQSLRSIDIDDAIFDDVRFSSLVNFKTDIGDEPTGRRNPFAPVE